MYTFLAERYETFFHIQVPCPYLNLSIIKLLSGYVKKIVKSRRR